MNTPSYTLENIEKAQAEASDTHSIPTLFERKNLKPEQIVKLIFILKSRVENSPRAERMWVKIEKATRNGYIGVLDSDPVYLSDLKAGDVVEFGFENIASIYHK